MSKPSKAAKLLVEALEERGKDGAFDIAKIVRTFDAGRGMKVQGKAMRALLGASLGVAKISSPPRDDSSSSSEAESSDSSASSGDDSDTIAARRERKLKIYMKCCKGMKGRAVDAVNAVLLEEALVPLPQALKDNKKKAKQERGGRERGRRRRSGSESSRSGSRSSSRSSSSSHREGKNGTTGGGLVDGSACTVEVKEALQLLKVFAAKEGMESITEEMPELLEQVLSGGLVVVASLPDPQLRTFLETVFKTLGLEEREEDDEEEAQDGEGQGKSVGFGLSGEGTCKLAVVKFMQACGSISGGGGGTNDSGEDDIGPPVKRAPRGPAMPSAAMLQHAAKLAAALEGKGGAGGDLEHSTGGEGGGGYAEEEEEEEEDGDDVGPMVEGKATRKGMARPAPRPKSKAPPNGPNGSTVGEREEWMMVPPTSLGILGVVKKNPASQKSRAFQSRSQRGLLNDDDKLAAMTAPKSAADRKADQEAEALLKEYRAKRGPSLVDLHADKRADKKQRTAGQGGGAVPFTWKRDEEMVAMSHKKYTPKMYEDLLMESRQLDTKFTKQVSRNFM